MIDSRDINDLHPTVKRGAEELIRRMKEKGYDVGISSTYRDIERQNAIYAQGRTIKGNIITNAKGGQSMHNYKIAFDIFKNVRGQEFSDNVFFKVAGDIWTEMGGEWGGNWKGFIDTPHFQFTNGLSLSQLQKGLTVPEDCKMEWEKTPAIHTQKELEDIQLIIDVCSNFQIQYDKLYWDKILADKEKVNEEYLNILKERIAKFDINIEDYRKK